MSKIRVTCEINDYSNPAKCKIRVHNHLSNSKMVELEVDGERYTVSATELKDAIDNATNAGW